MEQNFSSKLLARAVDEVSNLPGIGRKSALRLVLHLLRQDEAQTDALAQALTMLRHDIKYCKVCHNISDTDMCEICSNPKRDATTICVVENVQDVMAIEATGMFHGLYHVLGGVISPMEGDTTNYFIYRRLNALQLPHPLNITVIARGVAQNDELQYTDEATLGRALKGRTPFMG